MSDNPDRYVHGWWRLDDIACPVIAAGFDRTAAVDTVVDVYDAQFDAHDGVVSEARAKDEWVAVIDATDGEARAVAERVADRLGWDLE